MHLKYEVDHDNYIKCSTIEEFRQFCEDNRWKDENDFFNDTEIKFEDIEDEWFIVMYDKLYLK